MGPTPDRAQQRRGPRKASEPIALPGYRVGFAITYDADRRRALVGPGILSSMGELVRVHDVVPAHEALDETPRAPGHDHFLYLSQEGDLVIDRRPPAFDVDQFQDCHSDEPSLVAIGRMYIGRDGDILWAGDYRGVPREVWVAAKDWPGEADYRCDGTADEVEINVAMEYQSQAVPGSGTVRLTSGEYNCNGPIVGFAESSLVGEGPRTVLNAPALEGFRNFSYQVHALRHVNANSDRVYALFGGGVVTRRALGAGTRDTDVLIDGDLYVSGALLQHQE